MIFDFNKLTQRVVNSFVSNFVKKNGTAKLSTNTKKTKHGSSAKTANGIDMGHQVDDGVVPVVYGHVGLSNQQFSMNQIDDGAKTLQTVRFAISEGPIFGIAHRGFVNARDLTNHQVVFAQPGDSQYHFEEILIDDNFVRKSSGEWVYDNISWEATHGDNSGAYKQSGDVGSELSEISQDSDIKNLNDLGDVDADVGVDYVLYWNDANGRWEAKSFRDLLQNAFDNRNSTGDSSDDGSDTGQNLKGEDAKTASTGIKYTQWNPPPAEICWPDNVDPDSDDVVQTIEYSDYQKPAAEEHPYHGAALQTLDCPTPYYITEIEKSVNECNEYIEFTLQFPEGLYREETTTTHIKNQRGKFTQRDTTRPIEGAGDLLCLDPIGVEISEDGYTFTVRDRLPGSVTVRAMFTTTVCGREFVLDESSYTATDRYLGRKKVSFQRRFDNMNAGRGYDDEPVEKAGSQQIGSIKDPGDCNADDVLYYEFDNYTLSDYLRIYPDQIVTRAEKIKCYFWIEDVGVDNEYTISVPTYLDSVGVTEELRLFDCNYSVGEMTNNRYELYPPDHYYRWRGYVHDPESKISKLKARRSYGNTSGFYSATPGPAPLMIMDYCPDEGTTVGDIVFPTTESTPYACLVSDETYNEGDLQNPANYIGPWRVSYADDNETITVEIEVDQGTLLFSGTVGTVGGNNTNKVTLTGTVPNMKVALERDQAMDFIIDANTTGTVTITTTATAPNGQTFSCAQAIEPRVGAVTNKVPGTGNIDTNIIPKEIVCTNHLTRTDVAWFEMTYRPEQKDGDIELSEIGLYVAGRLIQEPTTNGITFSEWKNAGYNSTEGYSANPAWVFFDYLTNKTFGLGNEIVSNLTDTQKEDLFHDIYCAAKWCSYSPNGVDFVARFHGVFYGAESKYEALQKIADSFQGKLVYINGNPRLMWDGKGHIDLGTDCGGFGVKKLVNQANSANTSYNSGSLNNVFNNIKVKYNDPENYYKLSETVYKNQQSIAAIGERTTTVELVGCAIQKQAQWYARWLYETEVTNSDMISYTATWDHYDLLPGDLIHIVDTLRPDQDSIGGRACNTSDPNVLELDRDYSGDIAVMNSVGEIVTGTASNGVATMPSGTYVNNCVWNGFDTELKPTHKVIAVEESEDGVFGVTAQKHDPDKYYRIWDI